MTKKSLFELINDFKEVFEPYFLSELKKYQEEAKKFVPEYQYNLSEVIRISTLKGGKRIRPFLVYLGFCLGNGVNILDNTQLFDLACGLETFHSCALIFDDIIDKATARRGECTIETRYLKDVYQNSSDPKHQALSATLLAGMLSQSLADNFIDKQENKLIRSFYHDMQRELIAGQIDDTFGVGLRDFDELKCEEILNMMITKSGNYSIQKPLQLGLMLAGVETSKADFITLSSLAEKIGIIFQLKDDLLGIFGEEKTIGKSNISDITEGKKTLIVQKLYERSSVKERLEIRKIVGNAIPTERQIAWLKSEIEIKGVKDELDTYAKKLSGDIEKEVQNLETLNQNYIPYILELTDYVLNRVK
jgi:geranylgeranyl pyrophosphate synthase